MTNTVRLKRGSGSDPSASDMVVGEPVIRTDTAELFFKKDDGSVAKVSGGGGGPDFKYLALRNAANNGSASYPGNDFTLVTSGTTTAISPAAANTLLVSYGGVIQKPNSGTSTSGITGFIVDGSRIKTATNFAAAPDFILYQESGGIGEPSDETVDEAKLKVSNNPTNGYFLSAQSGNTGGLTWAAVDLTALSASNLTTGTINTNRFGNSTISRVHIQDNAINGDKIADSSITSAKILDDSIVNADINSSAAIAGTKIFPDFGSQNIVTSGIATINGGDVIIQSSAQPSVHLRDSGDNPDYILRNNDGTFIIYDSTNTTTRLQVNTDGHVDVTGNLDVGAGLDVTGSITTNDRIILEGAGNQSHPYIEFHSNATNVKKYRIMNGQGWNPDALLIYDIDADNTRLTIEPNGLGINRGANSISHGLDVGGTAIIRGNSEIQGNLTISGTVDGRDVATDGTKLDTVETNAKDDQTANEILTLIKTVDGAGSGLDADLWDGNQFSSYLNQAVLTTSQPTFGNIYCNDWFRNNGSGEGLYNQANDAHFYNAGDNYWHLNGNSGDITHGALILYDRYNGSQGQTTGRKGYLYWSSSGFGLLDSTGSWLIRGDGTHTHLTRGSVKASNWYYNNSSGYGLYNAGTTQHFYSDSDDYWNVAGGSSSNGIIFRDEHAGTLRGYVYANSSNEIGFLNSGGGWAFQCNGSSSNMSYNHLLPSANNSKNLGSSSYRWANLYVNDLQLSNEAKKDEGGNDVDGTWGDWTLQEGEENIFMINNRSGKKYRMTLQEVN